MNNRDLLAVRAYITAQDETQYNNLNQDTVIVDITHSNLQQKHIEVRVSKSENVDELRKKIHQTTGTPPHQQFLQVYDGEVKIAEIDASEDRKIGYYLAHHTMRVHCVDLNPYSISAAGALEDTSLVKKFI